MTFDRTAAEQLIAGGTPEMLWDSEAVDQGAEPPSSDYVDGWNDAVRAEAEPLADHLRAALAEIDRLTAERVARAASLRAEFETDDPDTIIATMRMVIAERDRMQDERDAARAELERMRPVVAANSPDVTLELIARVREAEAEATKWTERAARLLFQVGGDTAGRLVRLLDERGHGALDRELQELLDQLRPVVCG